MKDETTWLDDALAAKDIELAMTHYYISNNQIQATDGRILAGHPCQVEGEFLVPGEDLQRILSRLPGEPKITIEDDGTVKLRHGRFHGSIQTLDLAELWRFPEAGEINWQPFPQALLPILRDLRPFVSENAVHRWATGVCIQGGWALASNNIVLVGARCPELREVTALLPSQVIDFISKRKGLTDWAVTDHYMAFRWSNGAWMRSTLIDDKFPEKAAMMIQQKIKPTQKIDKDYREAVTRIAELAEDAVSIYADHVIGRTTFSEIRETIKSETPNDNDFSRWGCKYIESVMAVATAWSPSAWPNPAPFIGERVTGYIAGRR